MDACTTLTYSALGRQGGPEPDLPLAGFLFLWGGVVSYDGAMLEKGLVQVYTGDGKGKTTATILLTLLRRS